MQSAMAKTQSERLSECMEMQTKLRRVGLYSDPPVAAALRTHFNAFVRDGISCQIRIDTSDAGARIILSLSTNPEVQSGITLEKAK